MGQIPEGSIFRREGGQAICMHDLTRSSSPRAYKQEPVTPSLTTYCQALQPKQTGTMPALRSLLPHLGLLLCLALRFSPSLSASDNESCVVFDASYPSDNLGINITAKEVSGGSVSYAGESKPLFLLPFVLTRLSAGPYVCGHDGKWGAGTDVWRGGSLYSFPVHN